MADTVSRLFLIGILSLAGALTATGQVAERQCGYDRWPVKILNDKDRQRVNFEPVETTVAALTAIRIHEVPYPRDRRIEPEELKVYKLRAKLLEVRQEKDSDLHLIIADLDKPDAHMIAEIPSPVCAQGTGHEEEYRSARDQLTRIPLRSFVEITGVGFFDFLHDTSGGAKNGIELHPVLKIAVVGN